MTPVVGELRFDPEREAEFRIPSERPLALTSDLTEDPHLSAIIATLDPLSGRAPGSCSTRTVAAHLGEWRPVKRVVG
jgi:hypothetical protein